MTTPGDFSALKIEPIVSNSSRLAKGKDYAIPNNVSHINSSNNEDENLIRSKREAMLTIITPGIAPDTGEKLFEESQSRVESRPLKNKIKALMNSRVVEAVIVSLIIVYVLLVIVNLVMDDPSYLNNSGVVRTLEDLKYVELAILCVFILEILLKIYGLGVKGYYKDCWYLIDTAIVLATFALVIVDIQLDSKKLSGLNKIKGLFRLFRIFLLVRKANEFTRITTSKVKTTGFDIKSPVEKILELLDNLKSMIKDKDLKTEIDWAAQIIANNKLYDPIFDSSDDRSPDKNGAGVWLKSYTRPAVVKSPDMQASKFSKENSKRRSVLNTNLSKRNSGFKLIAATLPREASDMLDTDINNLNFDVFAFKKISKDDELVYILTYLFQFNNFFESLNINQITFYNFIKKIQSGYHANPYHNATHAADVVQTVNYFLTTGGYMETADLSSVEVAAMYLSAAIHDFDHPGSNNAYQISTSSMFALRYNDKAVLENHHVSASFGLLQEESYNIFANFSKADYKMVRERMISMVLATDMSTHFTDISKLKGRLAADFNIKEKDKHFTMDLIIHSADISNPSKSWEPCQEWTKRITQEFFDQGDQERTKGLPITHLCDKYTVNIGTSQVGFIDFVVAPLFSLIKEVLPAVDISNLETNKAKWKDLIDQYDKELIILNQKKEDQTQKIMG